LPRARVRGYTLVLDKLILVIQNATDISWACRRPYDVKQHDIKITTGSEGKRKRLTTGGLIHRVGYDSVTTAASSTCALPIAP